MRMVALIQKRQQQNAAQPNHQRPAPPRNTLLTVDLLNRGTHYSQSQWIFVTALWYTLLALTFPVPRNNLLIVVLPHGGTPFLDPPHMQHPTHSMKEDLPTKLQRK